MLSQSATTRLVTRLEDRGLLAPLPVRGRPPRHLHRGHRGRAASCWPRRTPTHDAALEAALAEAAALPELAPLVHALETLPDLAPTV